MSDNENDPLYVRTESINTRHRRELAERDEQWELERRAARRAARQRELEREPAPFDWTAHIDAVVARAVTAERERQAELLAGLVAKMRDEQADDIERATRSLNIELGELRVAMGELRLVMAGDRTAKNAGVVIDMPNPLGRTNH